MMSYLSMNINFRWHFILLCTMYNYADTCTNAIGRKTNNFLPGAGHDNHIIIQEKC